ncbi:hybrid sensor histidine kinase/response regulator transcription factor [Dysgonomonas macrotermitis]|uniref:histidine kinase n=1 Tax=Dysgonomonas macrotermitis TaxID=1346286 RepID=A0A1M5BQU1_9BACT|nr:two-component regulator propeller domain-containing protein [Dysgonomonas macrotermitis]SHF44904.1 Signal transduction histidine kinase [Dysgonomonas macrotermitis]
MICQFVERINRWCAFILTIIALTHTYNLSGQDNNKYWELETVPFDDLLFVNCFVQDPLGMIWMGTDKGVYSFDGYATYKVSPASEVPVNTNHVSCGFIWDSENICFGSGNGLFFFNYKKNKFSPPPIDISFDIRSLLRDENTLWIGSIQGLYKYHTNDNTLEEVKNTNIPHQAIYSIVRSNDGDLYIGTYDGLCVYISDSDKFEKIELPAINLKNNLCIYVLYYDSLRNCVWIGADGALFVYELKNRRIERLDQFNGSTVKAINLDNDGKLLVGTDNGLYVYEPENKQTKHIMHDSRYSQSLVNNSLTNIYLDKSRNIWIGTNGGVSLLRNQNAYHFIPISYITNIGDGNTFSKVYRDSRNNLWLGGTDGLILTKYNFNFQPGNYIWYRVGGKRYSLQHNHVRDIYEDKEQNIWIATDGGIGRYIDETQEFVYYNITDSTNHYNANWAYSIIEDDNRRLWISTWLGGIFVVDKDALVNTTKGDYVAIDHYSKANGLDRNHIHKILQDRSGHIWVIGQGLFKIDMETSHVTSIRLYNDRKKEVFPLFKQMLLDSNGYIWTAVNKGVCKIDTRTDKVTYIKFKGFESGNIYSMVEVEDDIWVSSSNGIILINKLSGTINYLDYPEKYFSGGYYDKISDQVIFGMVDGIGVFSKYLAKSEISESPIYLTRLYVDGKPFRSKGKSIRYVQSVELNYNQNNIIIEFSDLKYSSRSGKFMYKMDDFDDNWQMVESGSNRISYSHIPPGKYILSICLLDANGKPSSAKNKFEFIIHSPWYLSGLAKFIYALLLTCLLLWILNYNMVRHRLKIERIEKEKTLELSKLKIDFFTDISHEFKTPLSLIIAPVSKLIHETKNVELRKNLKMIEQNALQLNSLINQALNLQRNDKNEQSLICSIVEFVSFARKIVDAHQTLFSGGNVKVSFVSNVDKLYMKIDVIKMESILNNLLSNAYKYTNSGDEVELSVEYQKEDRILSVKVKDTGEGIAESELPYIFDRFFQSKNAKDKEGTGIGLALVKNFVELHDGKVYVESVEGEGTLFTVILPLAVEEDSESSENEDVLADTDERKYLILVVDDNIQITDFLSQYLGTYYRIAIANNGREGLDLCLKVRPDLIIADVMMPEVDGLEMCRQIRKHVPFATTPIIMLTAKDDMQTEWESIDIGIEYFIAKPFDIQVLLSRIKQLVSKQDILEEKIRIETVTTPSKMDVVSINEKFLTRITRIIEDRIADPDFNVNALSSISRTDTKQLYRKIKQLTGKTPVEYIRTIRLKKAAMLLSEKKFSIAEVVYLVGFSNHSYFTKCFIKEFGKTPKEFLEKS